MTNAGVDLPGVGHVGGAEAFPETTQGRLPECRLPQSLEKELLREEFDRQLIRVIFLARQTAELCLTAVGFNVAVCRGCGMLSAEQRHKSYCAVGATLDAIEKLQTAALQIAEANLAQVEAQ